METLPREVIFHILCAVADDRDFLACLCAARLFSVYLRAHVLERQCRRCRTAVAAARRLSPEALDYFRRTRAERFDSAAIYAAASVGRVDNVRWLHEHTDAPHRPAIAQGTVACGTRILDAAVKSGSATTVAFLLDQGYQAPRRAFVEAARLGRVDLLRMLDTAAPGCDMMHVARTAAASNHTDAFLFAAGRIDTMTRARVRSLFAYTTLGPAGGPRDAHFALLLIEHATLDSEALSAALQVAECGADNPNVRARLEHAVAAVCASRPRDRRIALGCLPLDAANYVDDPALLRVGPAHITDCMLMRRCKERAIQVDDVEATRMARTMWDVVVPDALVSLVARWFSEGGDLAGAAAVGWIFETSRPPRAHTLGGASLADVLAFALVHCRERCDLDAWMSDFAATDEVDLLRTVLNISGSSIPDDAVRVAATYGSMGVLRLLTECGYRGWPRDLVVCAARSRRLDVVQFVHGLAISADRSALTCAISMGCDDIVLFLCDHYDRVCPQMAMRMAIIKNHHGLVHLLCNRKDTGTCRGGPMCCAADIVATPRLYEHVDVDAFFTHCADMRPNWITLRDAAGLKNGSLLCRLVAKHHYDDDDVRYALAGAVDAGDSRAIRRITAHFGGRLASMPWPSRLVDICQSEHTPMVSMDALIRHAPYLCTAEDLVRRARPHTECGIDGRCAAEDQFLQMLCERLSQSSDAMVAT
ncbi:ankyrin repeat protein [Pandoravirus inopinatum]|uniref:Ankyrin repeat protein n=1 Tax=Pandoravirus inopinatum TaxID=1605721 RepID=A0A0B5J681_9VIRU|nr:ankyrin repeat protein [Pandoravirus inopinatum]AJF97230.1 ankyrin repeat protein [Pandoravirus inopinatum]